MSSSPVLGVIEPAAIEIGPIAVCADTAAVTRFAHAARTAGTDVPATFAISWLSRPEVRGAILSLARPGEVAVHEEQTFDLHAPLLRDGVYDLHVRLERTDDPARVVIASGVGSAGVPVLAMRTVLRLFAATEIAAPPPVTQVEQ